MVYSMWYLENLDMCNERKIRVRKTEEKEAQAPDTPLAELIGEVEFHVDIGPVVRTPRGLQEKEEQEIAFSSLPDIRSQKMTKESFIFTNSSGAFHVSFIQERDSRAKRGYVQRSVFVRCTKIIPALPIYISESLISSDKYTAENVLKVLLEMNQREKPLEKHRKESEKQLAYLRVIEKNRDSILECLFRGKSFLVLGKMPTEVSSAVCSLYTLCGFPYGGIVVPYKSSFSREITDKDIIIGGTNEHLFKKDDFDCILDLAGERFISKTKCNAKKIEVFLECLAEYFKKNPTSFQIDPFFRYAEAQGMSIGTKRAFREFFSSSNFSSWVNSMGYTVIDDKNAADSV